MNSSPHRNLRKIVLKIFCATLTYLSWYMSLLGALLRIEQFGRNLTSSKFLGFIILYVLVGCVIRNPTVWLKPNYPCFIIVYVFVGCVIRNPTVLVET